MPIDLLLRLAVDPFLFFPLHIFKISMKKFLTMSLLVLFAWTAQAQSTANEAPAAPAAAHAKGKVAKHKAAKHKAKHHKKAHRAKAPA